MPSARTVHAAHAGQTVHTVLYILYIPTPNCQARNLPFQIQIGVLANIHRHSWLRSSPAQRMECINWRRQGWIDQHMEFSDISMSAFAGSKIYTPRVPGVPKYTPRGSQEFQNIHPAGPRSPKIYRDRPFKTLGTSPLLGQALQNSWDKPQTKEARLREVSYLVCKEHVCGSSLGSLRPVWSSLLVVS